MRQCRSRLCWIFANVLVVPFVLQSLSVTYGEDILPIAPESATVSSAEIQPGIVTLAVSPSVSVDMEIIQWPDGGFSLPVKAFCALFGIEVQQQSDEHRIFFIDSQRQKTVEINWEQQKITVGEQTVPVGLHPVTRSQAGLLIEDDVYLDQTAFQAVFGAGLTLDRETGTLSLTTDRPLKISGLEDTGLPRTAQDANIRLISNPEISQPLVDKIYIQHATNYGFQESLQPINARIQSTRFNALVDTSLVGVSGSLLGLNYHLKPSITRFNDKATLQNIDWSIIRQLKGKAISLGSTEAGLSPLVSPSLNVWGLKFASQNAQSSFLSPPANYEFAGSAKTGNQVSVMLNQRTVQTVTAQNGAYEFEPVYLQGQSINDIQIVEKDPQNQETVLRTEKISNFSNLLPKGTVGYSTFLGRAPLQFYPLIPDQKTPLLMPQTEKWLAGGRLFYGAGHRLTVGLSAAADQTFGRPRTYFNNLDPLAVDLTGFSSYQRDANFFSGQNAALSLRYQLADRWLVSSDLGVSQYRLKAGSRLPIEDSAMGKAAQIHLERQSNRLSWYLDAFRYDPEYYTPAVSLYGNNLFDKQGLKGGITGMIQTVLPISYNLYWSHYQTNLQKLIPGGIINASHWGGTINSQLSEKNALTLGFSLIDGDNRQREFLQRSLDVNYRTQSLPWGLQGDVRAAHYFTNTVFLPSPTLGTNLTAFDYENNSLDTALDIPLNLLRTNHIRLAHRWSNFVDFGSVQGYFKMRGVFFEPFAQLSYGNKPQIQNQVGLRLGYQFKSGAKISVAYAKLSSSFQGPAAVGATRSQIKTDQVYFDFTDVFGLVANHLQSLGPHGEGQGILTGKVFADTQANGTLDPLEPGIKNTQLRIDNQRVITTSANGDFALAGLSRGYHTIEILPETLPLTINAENPTYKVKVQEGKTHRLNIPLATEGGRLSGHLELVDGQGQAVSPENMVLVLTNQSGESVKYTSVDAQGNYQFSNVSAGVYAVNLEPKTLASGRYKTLDGPSGIDLPVSSNYQESVEVKNLNLKLLAL
ncbi:hypothetical protein [Vampirovibrio sp.]|uniref:carboxypeptidase-like regulatory domain-containing protein n=1 Tax=Vampirovibrio sp. TaxID=2717857 RepID=UPI003593B68B